METLWSNTGDINDRIDAEYYRREFVSASRRLNEACETREFRQLWSEYSRIYIGIAGFANVENPSDYTPFLRPTEIGSEGEIQYDRLPWCRREWLEDWSKNGCGKPGDLLIEVKGNTRKVAVLDHRIPQNCIISGSAYRLRLKDAYDPHFYQAYFVSQTGQALKRRLTSNTTINYIDPASFRAMEVPIVRYSLQKAIGNKLRKAERLRELASNAWSGALNLLAAEVGQPLDAAAFDAPAKSALARPGYRCLSLRPPMARAAVTDEIGAQYFHPRREYARQVAARTGRWDTLEGLARPVRKKGKGRGFVGLDRIDSHTGVVAPSANGDPAEGVLFESEDILFSRLRPYLNKVTIWSGPVGVGSPELLIFRPRGNVDPYYLFAVVKSALGLYQVNDVTSGSTHPRVDEEVVAGIRVPRLPEGVEERIGEGVRTAMAAWREAPPLVDTAKAAVEALIDGTLDEAALCAESDVIERWLAENPSPSKGA